MTILVQVEYYHFPETWLMGLFALLANSVLNKSKSAIPPYSAIQRYCLLHLINQNCLLKTFLGTGPATVGGGAGRAMAPPRFCVAKRKKGNKGKQERLSKQRPLKGCH